MSKVKRIRRAVRDELKKKDKELHDAAADAFRLFMRQLPWYKRIGLSISIFFKSF